MNRSLYHLVVLIAAFAIAVAAKSVTGDEIRPSAPVQQANNFTNAVDEDQSFGKGPIAIKVDASVGVPPMFAIAQASKGLSRDFGLDGPHVLTYVSLYVPQAKWEGKAKTRDWKFSQPDTKNESAVTLYLGGPGWHQEAQSQFVTTDNKPIRAEDLLKRLEKPTTVLISLSGKMVDPMYLHQMKSDTIVVILGKRDSELMPHLDFKIKASDAAATPPSEAQPAGQPDHK
jgi:hypothetical protein